MIEGIGRYGIALPVDGEPEAAGADVVIAPVTPPEGANVLTVARRLERHPQL